MTRRLIESWPPIAALGEESARERRSMTALPPTYQLHVWRARRPLVASRAAVLASLLPADADRGKFLHIVGIHGDPIALRERISLFTSVVGKLQPILSAMPTRLDEMVDAVLDADPGPSPAYDLDTLNRLLALCILRDVSR